MKMMPKKKKNDSLFMDGYGSRTRHAENSEDEKELFHQEFIHGNGVNSLPNLISILLDIESNY